jgi:hypothetical protein
MKHTTAQMAVLGEGWYLYVSLEGPVADWPSVTLPGVAVPTVAARAAALAELGYVATAAWSWVEDRADDADDNSAVFLIAGTTVVPLD